jgi:RHS repeat-associated protein
MPGQVFDRETGWFYNWNRHYGALEGRYMQADPAGLAGGLNPYSYAGDDPTSLIDPTGLDVLDNIANRSAGLEAGDRATSLNLSDPCVSGYLKQNYGSAVAKTIPAMSLMSLDPRSGAREAYVSATQETVLVKGSTVGTIKGGQMAANAMGMSRVVQGLGVVITGIELVAGLATGYSVFATTAHLMAANACSCQK